MKRNVRVLSLSLVLVAQLPMAFAGPQGNASNPATDKFHQDIKAAVLNGSITIPQLKELQTNAEVLKAYKAEQKPGAPVDFVTPWQAVSKMKAIMATVKQPDQETLEQDLQVMMANKQPTTCLHRGPRTLARNSAKTYSPPSCTVSRPKPQVKSLQDSLEFAAEHQDGRLAASCSSS